jgi:hypothetical protein
LVERLAWACAVLLTVFHAILFVERLSSGALRDPVAAARWVAGFLLVAILVVLRRSRVPLFWGRRALVFWTLVLFLHWSATPVPAYGALTSRTIDSSLVLVVIPAGAAALAGIALGLLALLAIALRGGLSHSLARRFPVPAITAVLPTDVVALGLWARPPPQR